MPIGVAVLVLALSPTTLWAQDSATPEQPAAPPAPATDEPTPPPAEQPPPPDPPPSTGEQPPADEPPAEPPPPDPPPSEEPPTVSATPSLARQSSASVSIIDFAFQPSSVQVTAGGSVTWTNNGQEPHDATASGGFSTGELAPGESASVAFDQPGSISYICTIHPDMTGTVTVLASDDGGAPTGEDGTDDDGGVSAPTEEEAVASPDAAGTGTALPATGEETGFLAALGLALLALGAQLWVAQRLSAR
jgi:LPXTG-motif cell wall-anchored protein